MAKGGGGGGEVDPAEQYNVMGRDGSGIEPYTEKDLASLNSLGPDFYENQEESAVRRILAGDETARERYVGISDRFFERIDPEQRVTITNRGVRKATPEERLSDVNDRIYTQMKKGLSEGNAQLRVISNVRLADLARNAYQREDSWRKINRTSDKLEQTMKKLLMRLKADGGRKMKPLTRQEIADAIGDME